MPGTLLLVAAYAVIWLFVFGYIIWLVMRQEKLRREVEALRATLEGSGKQPGKK